MIGGGLRPEKPTGGLTRDWRRWWLAGVAFAPFIVASVYISSKPAPVKVARTHGGSTANFQDNPYVEAVGARFSRSAEHMSTAWKVDLVAADQASADRALDAAFAEVERVEAVLSEWRDTSEIAAINRGAGAPVNVSEETFAFLQLAFALAAETGGCFDPSYRPLSLLWRIETGDPRDAEPSGEEIAAALEYVGFRKIVLNAADKTVTLKEGMSLGVGAMGKGWAANAVGRKLRSLGIKRYLIDAGGDVLAGDGPKEGEAWSVAIAGPTGEAVANIQLENGAVATSGDYARFREIQGRRYSHIIDPRTGEPAMWVPSVSVRFADAARADAYATAVAVLGPEEALRFAARKEGLEVLLVMRDGSVQKSEGFSGR